MNYKGYEIDVKEENDMILWSIKRSDGVKMTSDSEYGNYNTVSSVENDLKCRVDKWFTLPMNKKTK